MNSIFIAEKLYANEGQKTPCKVVTVSYKKKVTYWLRNKTFYIIQQPFIDSLKESHAPIGMSEIG